MSQLNLPVPGSLYADSLTAIATLKAIVSAIQQYGAKLTIGEMIESGAFADAVAAGLTEAGGVVASYYAGACLGCLANAGVDWTDDVPASIPHVEVTTGG